MQTCGDEGPLLFPIRSLGLLAAVCYVAVAGGIGCTSGLRANLPGTDGAVATGGHVGSGGATSTGGSRSGGASGGTGGASGGTSGTSPCAKLGYDYCVADCLKENSLRDSPVCSDGAWSCRSGYSLASACPERGCGATFDACCDLTTGLITDNPCAKDGYRGACPDGSMETSNSQPYCIPKTVTGAGCSSLDRQACDGPAVGCSDVSGGFVTCKCSRVGTDASAGTWYCSVYIGP
jgi:hypothetical protein